ncbi:MAG: hypothetical protein ACLP3K_02725 [Candidatus Acidiferrales bacterium]
MRGALRGSSLRRSLTLRKSLCGRGLTRGCGLLSRLTCRGHLGGSLSGGGLCGG